MGIWKGILFGVGLTIAVVVSLMYLATQSYLEQQGKQPKQPTGAAVSSPPTKPIWNYEVLLDPMTGAKRDVATLRSINLLEFGFPYAAANNRGHIVISQAPKDRPVVVFAVDKGHILCSSIECSVRVRFDDKPPKLWQASQTDSRLIDALFIRDAKSFIAELQTAKKVLIEPTFYQASGILEFETAGFRWPQPPPQGS